MLERLKPQRNLKGLTIENFLGGKVASWMIVTNYISLLYDLVKLKLRNCKSFLHIPALQHLPDLKVLAIEGIHNLKTYWL